MFLRKEYIKSGVYGVDYQAAHAHGFVMRGNTRDCIQSRLYFFGEWEPRLTNWLARSLAEGDILLNAALISDTFRFLRRD